MGEIAESLLEGGVGGVAEGALGWLAIALKDSWKKRSDKNVKRERWDAVADRLVAYALTVSDRFLYVCPVAFPQTRMDFDKVYVPLSLNPLKGAERFRVDNFPSELFKHASGKCLVLDAAGMGKTTIGRRIFLAALRERHALPFFVDLRRLKSGDTVVDLLARNASIATTDKIVLEEFLISQNCLFVLDGFDEIAELDRADCDHKIRAFIDNLAKPMCFLTSRPDNDFSVFSDFERYGIMSLNRNEAYDLIKKYGFYGGNPDLLIEEVKKIDSDAVDSFLRNPLLTSLLFRAFEHKSVVPIKKNVFYQQVFDSLFEAHDLNKEPGFSRDKKTKLHLDEMHRMLRALASGFYSKGVVEMTRRDFKVSIENARIAWASDLAFSPTDFVSDVTSAVPLFSIDGDYIKWSHKSLLDYFVAEFFSTDFLGDKAVSLRRLALSISSSKNFNIISIIQELNPGLFNDECLLPAIEEVIDEMEKVDFYLGKKLSGSVRRDLQIFFSFYKVVISKELWNLSNYGDFERYSVSIARDASIDADRFRVVMGTNSKEVGSVFFYEHRALLPLRIMGIGDFSFKHHKIKSSFRSKKVSLRTDENVKDVLSFFQNTTTSSAKKILDDISEYVYITSDSLPTLEELKTHRDRLHSEMEKSRATRSAYEF